MTLAAAAAGADGVILEVHPDPDVALCDGPQSITLQCFEELMRCLVPIAAAAERPVWHRRTGALGASSEIEDSYR